MEGAMDISFIRFRNQMASIFCAGAIAFSFGLYAQVPATQNPENQQGEPALSGNADTRMTATVSDAVLQFKTGDAVQIAVFPDSMGFPGGIYAIDTAT